MDEFYRITKKAINFVFLIAIPMMIYFIIFAREGIFFLSGPAYEGAILPMQIIMPTLLFIGLTNIMGIQMLIPLGKEKIVLYSEIAGVVVDVILNILLIPRIASAGAAIGTLAAEVVVWLVQFWALKDIVSESYKKVRYISLLIALAIAVIVSFGVKQLAFGTFITLCVSSVLFFGVYTVILTLVREPLVLEIEKQLLGILGRKRVSD